MATNSNKISTAQKLAVFRGECRKYYREIASGSKRTTMKPSMELFSGWALNQARQIAEDEEALANAEFRGAK